MSDSKEDSKLQHLSSSTSTPDDPGQIHQDPTQQIPPPQFVSTPLFNIHNVGTTTTTSLDLPQFEVASSKRPRYTAAQWKQLSPSTSQQKQHKQTPRNILMIAESSTPSPKTQPPLQSQMVAAAAAAAAAASSSDTGSSPAHSPRPSHSAASTQEATNPESHQFHQQFRKGKYVSPVWKPNEMLWLARAWRVQYQGGGSEGELTEAVKPMRGKTRADKDREVAEYLGRHGVNRDAKTAGTKWDNMLGEFRKVYEWEKGWERDQVGKSYFRLSPYERKLHRLPASFDEEVFEELSQFMGSRMRTPQTRVVSPIVSDSGVDVRAIVPAQKSLIHPPYREEDLPSSARAKQIVMSGTRTVGDPFAYGGRGGGSTLGFETSLDVLAGASAAPALPREVRRVGKMRMIWEESVSLWAEEGEHHRGRVKLQGCNFLNADEITFLDDSMVACTMEAFEDGPLKGLSVDRFLPGQQVKVFGRRKSFSASIPTSLGPSDRPQHHHGEPSSSFRSTPTWEFQDPTDYYVGCLRVPPPALPSLFELSWHIQAPPPEEFRFPLRKEVYKDLPQGKELFFTTSSELLLDCRGITYDLISPIMKRNPSLSGATAATRDSFIGLWDDCINGIISKFCGVEMVFVRKNCSPMAETMQDEWPNVSASLRNLCLWRGEETDQLREGHVDPSSSIVGKLLWTYTDLPYIFGYYAIGYNVTFCAISQSQDRIIRTDLYTVDLSNPTEKLKALVPCWRIAGLLPLLADRCLNSFNNNHKQPLPYSDFESIDLGSGNIMEMTPNTMTKFFSSKRRWAAVKEIYDFLDQRIPHAEYIVQSSEKHLGIVFKPRGCRVKPRNCDQLIEALKQVAEALVALHDLSFMHRDLGWEKVMKRSDRDNEWLISGFDEAMGAPQLYPHDGGVASGRNAPEMGRGLHGVKVDVWGVGQLIKTCGLDSVPKMLRELQNRCLDHNPEHRPTAADCYRHLLQLQQSSMSTAAVAVVGVY